MAYRFRVVYDSNSKYTTYGSVTLILYETPTLEMYDICYDKAYDDIYGKQCVNFNDNTNEHHYKTNVGQLLPYLDG